MKLALALVLSLPAITSANVVRSSVSVECLAPGERMSALRFDLYPTGHPMGGTSMFTGMFELETSDYFRCGDPTRGHITTLTSPRGRIRHNGIINCANDHEIDLETETELWQPGVPILATLSDRDLGVFGPGVWTRQAMTCTQLIE